MLTRKVLWNSQLLGKYTKTGKECYIAFYIPAKLCLNHIKPHETLRLFQGKTLADVVDHFLSPIC